MTERAGKVSVGLSEEEMVDGEPLPLPPGTRDVTLLAWTYPWWRRPFTWLTWHVPVVRWLAGKVFKVNPYRRVVAVVDTRELNRRRRGEKL